MKSTRSNVYAEGPAKYHDAIMEAGYRDYKPFVEFMKKILTKADTVLELGAGTGTVLTALEPHCAIEALENSQTMVTVLKKNHPKVPIHTQGIGKIPGNEKYTLIFSHSGPFSIKETDDALLFETYLESKDQVIQYLGHIARLLKKGGRLLINKEPVRLERHLKLKNDANYFSTTIEDGSRILRTHVVMDKKGNVLAKQTFTKTAIPYEELNDAIMKLGFSVDLEMVSVVSFKKVR